MHNTKVPLEMTSAGIPKDDNVFVKKIYMGNRWQAAAEFLENASGTIIDLGSRDRVLLKVLGITSSSLAYTSADLEGTHDYAINLEQPFPFPEASFDYVVILDVLEHLENIHFAFDECLRIARKQVIVSLPNMATLSHRISYLLNGKLNTQKYDLLSTHQGDRHRWLTNYDNSVAFIREKASQNGCKLKGIIGCRELFSPTPSRRINVILTKLIQSALPLSWGCSTFVFNIKK